MKCRSCQTTLKHIFIDLFNAPPSNSYLSESQLEAPEQYFPLKIYVCHECFLVQVEEYKKSTEIFSDEYAYFSSYSSSWLDHAKKYVDMIIPRLQLNMNSSVMEIASNDGYLLQNFVGMKIPCFGVEPTACTASAAKDKGVETLEMFFSVNTALDIKKKRGLQDLIIGNNVLAHVPDICDFIEGLSIVLSPHGSITLEFPHLLNLIEQNQFDTIYHEHFSYLSLVALDELFKRYGLEVYDVDELSTHGGSLRLYIKQVENQELIVNTSVKELIKQEITFGLNTIDGFGGFSDKIDILKNDFLSFLIDQSKLNKKVVAYGAAAKGNTLLNFCGVKGNRLIEYVVDASPHKQGKYLPGSHIPIVNEEELHKSQPDYVIILPWNLENEISSQLAYIRKWGGKFVVATPQLRVIE